MGCEGDKYEYFVYLKKFSILQEELSCIKISTI